MGHRRSASTLAPAYGLRGIVSLNARTGNNSSPCTLLTACDAHARSQPPGAGEDVGRPSDYGEAVRERSNDFPATMPKGRILRLAADDLHSVGDHVIPQGL